MNGEFDLIPRYFQLCPACLQLAWEYRVKPEPNRQFFLKDIIHRDNPQVGQLILCQVCRYTISMAFFNPNFVLTVFQKVKKLPFGPIN